MEREFLLTELFELKTTLGFDKNKIEFSNSGNCDFVGRTSMNWGIQGSLSEFNQHAPNPRNSFSLVQVGESVALWRENDWYASQNIFLLKPKYAEIEKSRLYIQGAINKKMSIYGKSYTSYPTKKTLSKTTISLPVIESTDLSHVYTPDDIDWGYMERYIAELEAERIAELEAERIAELEAYLTATGLDDCDLTCEDEATLAADPLTAEFTVGELFGKSLLGKYHNPNDLIADSDGHPYICASNANNGINKSMPRVVGENLSLTPGRIIAWGKQCPMFCFHDEPCVTSQGMYFLDMSNHSDRVCSYICSLLTKACAGVYGYSNCLIGKVMDEIVLSLPVIESPDPSHVYTPDDIDWGYMERYIRAVEKLVMADVVAYKDEVIETTRRIVSAKA